MIFEFTRQGSFKGVEFNYTASTRSSGRKAVFHTFPNSSDVIWEDLGRLPRVFSLDMLITGKGDEYFNKRNALIKVLDENGSGELVHPLYGKMIVMIEGSYSLNEVITDQGRATITASFVRVDSSTKLAKPTKRTIDQNRQLLESGATNSAKGIEPEEGTSITETLTTANSDVQPNGLGQDPSILNTFLEGVQSIQSNIAGISSKFATVSRLIQNPTIYSNYSALIRKFELTNLTEIADIIDAVGSFYDEGRRAITDAELWLDGIKSTYDYGDDIDESPATTRQAYQAQQNNIAFRNLMQTIGVAYGAVAMIEIDYTTNIQLQAEETSIMNQIDKVSALSNLDDELFELLKQLKSDLREAIDQQRLNIFGVETITISYTSTLTTLVHSLYGNLDNYDIVRDLNSFNDPSFITGDILVVTDV